jgi:predicted nucleotidyltransferase
MSPDRNTIIALVRELKPDLMVKYDISRIGIFGSIARDEATADSDIDIVVEMKPDLFKRAALKSELEELLHRNVDVVRYSKRMNLHLKKRIDKEAMYV